jgi:hypothetical protein
VNNIKCIFDLNKTCDDCGECDRCDLDKNKTCDNCGKCLDMDKSDMRAVRVDEVVDDLDEVQEYEDVDEIEDLNQGSEEGDSDIEEADNEVWEYIDDIDGLSDILNDKENFEKYAEEEYPGLIKLKKIK